MTDSTNFSAIRARLRYQSLDEFVEGYGRFISQGGMFLPMAPQKLKPVGTTVRFQFLLADGSNAFLGEGVVRQIKGLESGEEGGPVGMVVRFTKLSPESKGLVERIVAQKELSRPVEEGPAPEPELAAAPEPEPALSPAPEQEERERGADFWGAPEERGGQIFTEASPVSQEAQDALTVEAELEEEAEEGEDGASEGDLFGSSGDEIFDSALFSSPDEGELKEEEPDLFGTGDIGFSATSEPDFFSSGDFALSEPSEPAELAEPSAPDPFGGEDFLLSEPSSPELFDGHDFSAPEASEEVGLSEASEPEFFGGEDFSLSAPSEVSEPSEELFGDLFDEDGQPAEPASSTAEPPQEEVVAAPRAIKETEAGIKVMSFDGQELDERGAREFEEFALGGGEEFDEVFDNIFGGGDGGDDLFGGAGWGEEEGEQAEPVEQIAASAPVVEPPAVELPVVEPPVATPPQMPVEVADELSEPEEEEEPPQIEEPQEVAEEEAQEEEVQEDEVAPALELPPLEPQEEDELAEEDPAASEKILSLLDMDQEESEAELTLNLGAGLDEESDLKDEEERSLESLFATTRKEIESKAAEEEEEKEDGWDILDDLLGESDLPPPAATASPFEVPVGGADKRKRKGFMSRLFGKD